MLASLEEDLVLCPADVVQSQCTHLAAPHSVGIQQLENRVVTATDIGLAVDSLKKFLEYAPDDPQAATIESLIPTIEALIKK